MKKTFIYKSILFTAIAVAGVLWMNTVSLHILEDGNVRQQFEIIREMSEAQEKIQVLLVGDSYVAYGVHSEYLPDGWINYAYPSNNWKEMLRKIQYINSQKDIQYIIVPMDAHDFAREGSGLESGCNLASGKTVEEASYILGMNRIKVVGYKTGCMFPIVQRQNRAELRQYAIQKVKGLLTGKKVGKQFYISQEGSVRYTTQHVLKKEEIIANQSHEKTVNAKMKKAYQELLEYAQENHIQVIGVRYPVTQQARREIDMRSDKDEVQAIYSGTHMQHKLDLSKTLEERYELFQNQDHLNDEGAREYTSILVEKLLPLIERK